MFVRQYFNQMLEGVGVGRGDKREGQGGEGAPSILLLSQTPFGFLLQFDLQGLELSKHDSQRTEELGQRGHASVG